MTSKNEATKKEDGTVKEVKEPSLVRRKLLRFQTPRTLVQLIFFFLFNGLIFGLGPWPILLPVIGLLGIPLKTMGDALGALQYMLYLLIPPVLALASIFIASVIVGRAFCAWACPFGFMQDILEVMKKRHTRVSLRTHNQLINVKYFVLVITLLVSGGLALSASAGAGAGYKQALGIFAVAPFNTLSPADTLFAVVPRTVSDVAYALPLIFENPDAAGVLAGSIAAVEPLFWIRLVILALTIALSLLIPRGWCRYLCPQGAFSAVLMRFSFLGLKRDPVRCTRVGCRDCVEACPMMVPILDEPWEKFTHPECIMCLKCTDACSTAAIKPKFP